MNQKMKSLLSLSLFLLSFTVASAQQLEMIEFKESSELSAAQYKEYDANQNACALIKLGLIANDPVFEGSVVKSENKGGVYWLYVPQGTSRLTIQTSNYLPLRVEFEPVKSLFTYHMTVAPKQAGGASAPQIATTSAPIASGASVLPISIPALPAVSIGGQATQQAGPVEFNMVLLKDGRFEMGATPEQKSVEKDETPVHYVKLSKDFYIGETEVTQALWERIMGTNPSAYKGPNNPVENITYREANEFCLKLSQLTGKTFRLPTEAEWEYAARGAEKRTPTMYSGDNTAEEVGWSGINSGGHHHEVKTKKPNEAGLYDMSGNVWEICEDYKQDYTAGDAVDPVCRKKSELRVRRGGSFEDRDSNNLRVAFRRKLPERESNKATGMRVVMEVD